MDPQHLQSIVTFLKDVAFPSQLHQLHIAARIIFIFNRQTQLLSHPVHLILLHFPLLHISTIKIAMLPFLRKYFHSDTFFCFLLYVHIRKLYFIVLMSSFVLIFQHSWTCKKYSSTLCHPHHVCFSPIIFNKTKQQSRTNSLSFVQRVLLFLFSLWSVKINSREELYNKP